MQLNTSLVCFLLYALCFFKRDGKSIWFILGLLILLFFTRPTSIIVCVATGVFVLLHYRMKFRNLKLKFSLLLVILLTSLTTTTLMFRHWDFTEQYKKGNIVTYMDAVEGSELYYEELRIQDSNLKFLSPDRPVLHKILYFIFYNPFYFLKTATLKVWYLISGVRPYYSFLHNIYSILWLSLMYILYVIGWWRVKNKEVKIFTIVVIILNCTLISISTVDWDNRFYIPMEAGIALLAGGGAAFIITELKRKLSR